MLFALTIHEMSHAWTADRLGDPTAKRAGRISLNPLVHLDPLGTLMLFVIGFGWAKPVMVNPLNFRQPGRDNALVGLAGPGSNLLSAVALGLLLRAVVPVADATQLRVLEFAALLLVQMVLISLLLGLFNLIPIPPLDGSHILRELLPPALQGGFDEFSRLSPIILMVVLVILSRTGVLGALLRPPVDFLFRTVTGFSLS